VRQGLDGNPRLARGSKASGSLSFHHREKGDEGGMTPLVSFDPHPAGVQPSLRTIKHFKEKDASKGEFPP